MVLEIILPILAEFIRDPIKRAVVSAKRHICYAFKCDSNVEKLRREAEELNNKRSRLQISVDVATRNGKEIHKDVTDWLDSTHNNIEEAQYLIDGKDDAMKQRCLIELCPDLKMRYKLSRKADKKASAIRNVNEPAGPIDYSPNPKQMIPHSVYSREALPSRVSMLEDVMKELKDPERNMIGVYGMGGVGKTTLAKEVHRQAHEDKLFEVVVFVAVSQCPDIARIQKEIAEVLGLNLHEDGLPLRANRLCERLKEEKKILIILDDVWKQLNLEEVGIPLGADHKGCKILLTSRSKDVLSREMATQKELKLDVLQKEEAWGLFQMIATDAKDSKFTSTATEIVKKCGDLPLLLLKVAKDLQKRELHAWEDKLMQLSAFDNEEIQIKVHSILESSYENLPDNEVKSFFLLCGLLGQSNIQIQSLISYSMGLGLFKRVASIEETRNRVLTLIDKLKDECLLLDGDMDGFVKMHDIVGDTALTIASRVQHAFIGLSGSREKVEPKKDCTRISLHYCDIQMLPEVLDCPKAEILLIFTKDSSLQIPDSIFQGTTELKVVDLSGMNFVSLPSSFGLLANIHTLCLHRCRLNAGMDIIGRLEQLEVLSFADSYIVELPRETEHLSQLKLLDLSNCTKLKVIPANVLCKLTNLEELYMRNSFTQWEEEGINNDQKNASLGELEELSSLMTLELEVPNPELLQDSMFPKVLKKYWILIGERSYWIKGHKTSKSLMLNVDGSIHLEDGIKVLLREAEYLYLGGGGVRGAENVLYDLDEGGFTQLKHLDVHNDRVIQQIMKCAPCPAAFPNLESLHLQDLPSLKTICDDEVAEGSFSRLTALKVLYCHSLTNLLSVLTARCLLLLQVLHVESCESMEYIVVGESEDSNEMVEFTQLVSLNIGRLPNLKSFCKEKKQWTADAAVSEDSSSSVLFNTTKVSFPKLETMELLGIELKHSFSVSSVKSLSHLKTLEIEFSESMEEIILTQEMESLEEEERKHIVFPKLGCLHLNYLPNLKRFCRGYSIEFQSLRKLEITLCDKLMSFVDAEICNPIGIHSLFNLVTFPWLETLELYEIGSKYLFSVSLVKSLLSLKTLKVQSCYSMEEIILTQEVELLEEEERKLMVFPKLNFLYLRSLPKLKRFCGGYSIKFQCLRNLKIIACNKLMSFVVPSDDDVFDAETSNPIEIHPLFNHMVSFPTLETLKLDGIGSKHSFSVSLLVESLLHLKTLEIEDCKFMKEIIQTKEIKLEDKERRLIVFPKLDFLRLHNLQKLKRFYGGYSIGFQSLRKLEISQCDKLMSFILPNDDDDDDDDDGDADVAATAANDDAAAAAINDDATAAAETSNPIEIHSLFNHMVAFPSLEVMDLASLSGLKYIWPNQLSNENSFRKLKSLRIARCSKLLTIFPLTDLRRFQSLETLKLEHCTSMQEIYQVQQQLNDAVTIEPITVVSELKDLYIESLSSLKYIIMYKNSQGEFTEDSICRFNFRQLCSIKFKDLEEFTSFHPWIHTELPKLKCIEVYNCPKAIKFASDAESQPIFLVDKVKDSLEEVTFEEKDLVLMERGVFPVEKLSKLKVVKFSGHGKRSIRQPIFMVDKVKLSKLKVVKRIRRPETISLCLPFLKRLRRLETLVVEKHGSIHVLFSHGLVGEGQLVFVKHLKLSSLDNLKHIWNQHSQLKPLSQSLQTLQVDSCPSLINIAPSSSSFQNLSGLHVSMCHALRNLVTTPTAQTMVCLTEMTVERCYEMTEIVAKDDAAENEIIIVFNKLKSLKLCNLPSLTSFCSEPNHAFYFPSLERVHVCGCSEMITFYDGPLSTPKLQGILISRYCYEEAKRWENEQQWEGNLNATITKFSR